MKHKLMIAIPVAGVLLVAGVALFLVLSGTGSAAVERYVADQVSAAAADNLNPRLSFTALRYHYPLTTVLNDVRLVADDPAKPGATVDIFVAKHVTLEMAEIPRSGQPLRIQKLTLDHPEFRAVCVGEKDSRLVGYGDLLRNQPAAQPAVKLTDVFEIRLIQIVDGLVVYKSRRPGAKPMKIDQISFHLNVEPAKGSEAGWYTMEMDLERKPVFSTHFAGRVNLDTRVVDVQPVRVELRLGRAQDHYLPPEIQAMLKEHEVSGNLVVEASGSVNAGDWRASGLKAQVTLADAHFASGEHHFPMARLEILWTMADGRGKLEKLDANLLGGQLEGTGEVALADPMGGHVDLTLSHIRLEQCLRNEAGENSKFRGDLSAQIGWHGPLTDALKQSQGSGTLRIADGRLDQIPVLSSIINAVTKTMKAVHLGSGRPSDTADVAFTFEGDRVNFNKVFVVTRMAALHGHGDIYFGNRMDMLFNAGALEKIESLLGQVGAFMGKMSDEVSAYTVTGTLDDPQVGVKVAPSL
jgi:hypothetical protein